MTSIPNLRLRQTNEPLGISTQLAWWTTSGGSTFIPSGKPTSSSPSHSSQATVTSLTPNSDSITTTFTTQVPVSTIIQPSATFTSFSQSIVTATSTLPTSVSAFATVSAAAQSDGAPGPSASAIPIGGFLNSNPVCLGHGLDSTAEGILAALVLPSAIGLIIWLIFAIVRPRFRQVYGLREWFLQQDLRPKPLSSSFWAFLFPHVPLVPNIPTDIDDAGQSASVDAELFPSDEQLSQRVIWIAFLIVLGWTILGLAGALPLYLVSTPCLANYPPVGSFGGSYSTLQDLSLTRLLRLFDSNNVTTNNLIEQVLAKRADDGVQDPQHARERVIVLTVLVIVLALLPALIKIIREFNKTVAYRDRWIETKCRGLELGWLSTKDAPGFTGWGEKRLKDFIVKSGLSASMENNARNARRSRNGLSIFNGLRSPTNRQSPETEELEEEERAHLPVDIQSLFTICDTHDLALLIDERDAILENLEIAETRYINSFRLTTPEPSIADYQPPKQDSQKPYISLPKKLSAQRHANPAYGSSSLTPTSFVAPTQFYSLRGVRGVTGGQFAGSALNMGGSFTESIRSRLVGSRFQEVNRSTRYGELPMGSRVNINEYGELGPVPDPRLYGPNQPLEPEGEKDDGLDRLEEEDWVDLEGETSPDMASHPNGTPEATASSSFRRARTRQGTHDTSSSKRETFPFRKKAEGEEPPPHLRLQPSQPFVRPLEGMDYDQLGHIYADITLWRSKLKAINVEISDAQHHAYNDIADGARIKGWLMVGRGLHYIPNIQLVEGRAKEDIRWDVLQNERSTGDSITLWVLVFVIGILLACGLTAAAGLALIGAPDVVHVFPFLGRLLGHDLATGIATVLVPAVASCLFIYLALAGVRYVARIHGSISLSGSQLLVFRSVFYMLTFVAAIFLVTVGALLFSIEDFTEGSNISQSVGNGSIYIAVLILAVVMQMAIIVPGMLLLQPMNLWHTVRNEKRAVTPRQRFRALYPRIYDPTFATGACILAIVFASTFSLIFPLIGPPVVVLLFLTLIAHRFLVGYVYGRTHSQTGGLLQIWLLKRFATLLAIQPILLGLIFLSRRFWIEGGVLIGVGLFVIVFVESYCGWRTRQPGSRSLSPITRDSLANFKKTAAADRRKGDDEGTSMVSSAPGGTRPRGSMASVLEMMSLTLAVMPSSSPSRSPVPLQTETLDDLVQTERAARTNPYAPPHLPPLPFTDHAEDMAGILYAPELIAPPPIIWLPNTTVGRSEAIDLQKYHGLHCTLDIKSEEDVPVHSRPPSRRA